MLKKLNRLVDRILDDECPEYNRFEVLALVMCYAYLVAQIVRSAI